MLSEYTIQWEKNREECWEVRITKQAEASRKSTKILYSSLKSNCLSDNMLTGKRKRRSLNIFIKGLRVEWGISNEHIERDDVFVNELLYG